jgi:hypothetical protein
MYMCVRNIETLYVGHHYAQITQITQIRHKPSYKPPEVKTNFREHSKITGVRDSSVFHTFLHILLTDARCTELPPPFLTFILHPFYLFWIQFLYYFTSSYKPPEVKTNFREHSKITGVRGTESSHTHLFSFIVLFTYIAFIFNKISLLFHLFILNLTCSCP